MVSKILITNSHNLLMHGDPEPVEHVNPESDSPILLVCEHAGQYIPQKLHHLGLPQDVLGLHIGWDIGAGAVTRYMAEILGAHAILQRYSRLVIDCNRPPQVEAVTPVISDEIPIPGNKDLTSEERDERVKEIFDPFNKAIEMERMRGDKQILLSIHSFTPVMSGFHRPWDIGFLYRKDKQTAVGLAAFMESINPRLCIGFNQPYTIDNDSDWFVPAHGEPSGLPHSLIEIRNDHISSTEGQKQWASLLSQAAQSQLKRIQDSEL